ncbi:MAG: hypothetical protein QM817_33240 [Archangium sp.]
MGIDSLKSGFSSVVQQVTQKVEAKLEELKPAPPPPPPALKPTEEFTDAKKKPMSITGKFTPLQPGAAGSVKSDLSADVSSLRALANTGMAANAIGLGRDVESTADGKALKDAIAEGSDTKIDKLVNSHPELLKELTPAEKGKALETLRSGWTSGDDQKAMVAIVRSCETKGELRATLQAASGGTSQKDMHKYDKQMTDFHPYLIADLLNPDNKSLPEAHPKSITANDHVSGVGNYPTPNMDDKVSLSPGDEASRKKFLDTLTQVDTKRPGNDPSEPSLYEPRAYGCGPTCIIASAMQGPDPKGSLSKLCDYNLKNMTDRYGTNVGDSEKAQLQDLKKRIDNGEQISRKDIDLLQKTTYNAARNAESKLPDANSGNESIDQRAILTVLKDSGIGTAGGVPKLVDTDQAPDKFGKTNADHFVLQQKNGEIYDPWPRKDGKQIMPAGSDAAKRYEQSFID